MKLSTTNTLCVGPTPRQNAVARPGGSWRTYSTRMAGIEYWMSAAPSTASGSTPFLTIGGAKRDMIDDPVTRWNHATGMPLSSMRADMRST